MYGLGLGLVLLPLGAFAANYDPYTSNVTIKDPGGNLLPLLPQEFDGRGTFCFQAGNQGDSPLPYPQGTQAT